MYVPAAAATATVAAGSGSDGEAAEDTGDSEHEELQHGKKRKQQPAKPRRQPRRGAGQVDYQLLHEQLFGFSAFAGDGELFRDDDDEDYSSDHGAADSDD